MKFAPVVDSEKPTCRYSFPVTLNETLIRIGFATTEEKRHINSCKGLNCLV